MIIELLEGNNYLIKLLNTNIDIYNKENLQKITEKIYKKIIKNNNLDNTITLDFYLNKEYGTIITLKCNKNSILLNDEIEVKIIIHTNVPFLYKIDYFSIIENKLTKENIYYYKNNFYLEIKNTIDQKTYLNIIELSDIIYEESYKIINEGIKINI